MDLFKQFATDKKAEVEGRWFNLSKTAKILVARSGNPEYVKALRKAFEANKLDFTDKSDEANDLATAIIIQVSAEHILLGWQGIEYKGQTLAYTSANAAMLLTELPDFRKKVDDLAGSFEAFKLQDVAATGNA